MSDAVADFAVFGTSTMARLLAGLLATRHGRNVIFVGESQAGYRLPRGVDLSVAPITRPETWAMLGEGVAETVRLLSRIGGRGAWNYINPILFAEEVEGIEALSHIRNMARGFRIAAEPVAPSLIGPGRSGIVVRDAVRINRPVLEPALDRWLIQNGVRHVTPDRVTIGNDGAATIEGKTGALSARQAVLVGSDAIMAWLPVRQWPTLLQRRASSAILTMPTQPLAAPTMLEISSGTTLLQQADGGIAAVGSGDLAEFSKRLQHLLGAERRVEQAGQTGFMALATTDGAPAFGRAAGSGADVVAATGTIGAFLAPALARWLSNEAQPHQAHWFGARLVTRNARSEAVEEYAPRQSGAAA